MLVNDALRRLLGTFDYKLAKGSRQKQGSLLKQRFLFMADARLQAGTAHFLSSKGDDFDQGGIQITTGQWLVQ